MIGGHVLVVGKNGGADILSTARLAGIMNWVMGTSNRNVSFQGMQLAALQ